MATYIIGDVHGCYQTLLALLEKINFNTCEDTLYFVGDLVGRGPQPFAVIQFVVNHACAQTVLGNHDLWAMAIAYGCQQSGVDQTLWGVFDHAEGQALLDAWRLKSTMMLLEGTQNIAIAHAGIPPCWSLTQAFKLAQEVDAVLHGNNYQQLLSNMESDLPCCWQDDLQGFDRYRYIINALTRMRFCNVQGCLDFKEKSSVRSSYAHLKPWFDWPLNLEGYQLFYGHWAALKGRCAQDNIVATDTGCVYGAALSAFKVNDQGQALRHYQVPCMDLVC